MLKRIGSWLADGASSGYAFGPMAARSRSNSFTAAGRLIPGKRGAALRAEGRRVTDAIPDGPVDSYLDKRVAERRREHQNSVVPAVDLPLPPEVREGQGLKAAVRVGHLLLEPLSFDEYADVGPGCCDATGLQVLDGPFLAALTDGSMRHQPAWVLVVAEREIAVLRVWNATNGSPLRLP